MAEYIEREAFRKKLAIGAEYLDGDTLMTVVNLLDCEPAADVAPVVHGRWIERLDWSECSECHTAGSPRWKRCPVCEAKMDGKRKDGEG